MGIGSIFYLWMARFHARKRSYVKAGEFYNKTHPKRLTPYDIPRYAESLHECGESTKALDLLDKGLLNYPNEAALHYMNAHILRETDRSEEALPFLHKAIELEPESFIHWYTRALVYQERGEIDASIQDFREAIQRESKDSVHSTWFELGANFFTEGRYEEALHAYTEVLHNPDKVLPIYHYRRAMTYDALGQLENAIAEAKKAVELNLIVESEIDKGKSSVYNRSGYSGSAVQSFRDTGHQQFSYTYDLAHFYERKEQIDEAIDTLTLGLKHYPESDVLRVERASHYRQLNKWEEAIQDIHRALEIDPGYVRAWIECGHIYRRMGEEQEALKDFLKAYELDPESSILPYWIAGSYVVLDEPVSALAYFDQAIQLDSQDPVYFVEKAELLESLGQYADAILVYDQAIALEDSSNTRMKRSHAYFMADRYEAALEDVQYALELDGSLALEGRTYYARGMILWNMNNTEQAISDFTKAMELDPEQSVLYEKRARCYYQLGQMEEAIEDCNKGLEIDPKDEDLIWFRGLLLLESSDYRGALADAEAYLELNPEDSGAYYNLGLLHYRLTQYEEAIELLSKSIELSPTYSSAYIQRAYVYYDMVDMDQAADDLVQWALNSPGELSLEEREALLDEVEGLDEDIIHDAKVKLKELQGHSLWLS